MRLKERENSSEGADKEQESTPVDRESIPVDSWDRPDDWERASFEELPEPDYDEYPIPEPDELTEVPASDS
ncbi:hypothetical protein SAMN05192552_10506 [Natrinema hispanicum]|uniref:Uncharacterized protein n=1 Tax=Natrinema hispanicum TaxID=392421 RepID=A0A1G6XPQ0_9EURY|nr:hypothetical protein SAMN05192552_10506 [Natrinema hispanicum]